MLVQITIPLASAYVNDVFFKQIHIECDQCPSLDQLISLLKEAHEKEKISFHGYVNQYAQVENSFQSNPEDSEYLQCIQILESCSPSDFPCVTEKGLIQSNIFVVVEPYGIKPLVVKVIEPLIFKKES